VVTNGRASQPIFPLLLALFMLFLPASLLGQACSGYAWAVVTNQSTGCAQPQTDSLNYAFTAGTNQSAQTYTSVLVYGTCPIQYTDCNGHTAYSEGIDPGVIAGETTNTDNSVTFTWDVTNYNTYVQGEEDGAGNEHYDCLCSDPNPTGWPGAFTYNIPIHYTITGNCSS
jgi:hypothetical protein